MLLPHLRQGVSFVGHRAAPGCASGPARKLHDHILQRRHLHLRLWGKPMSAAIAAFGGSLDIDPQTLADMARRRQAQDAIVAEARAKAAPRKRRGGRIHAGMDITRIMSGLSRIGWGPIRGCEFAASRAILTALVHAMEDQRSTLTASAKITATQLAKRASVSLRHTRRCLQWLEDAGVIEWWRGGIRNGTPTVGLMRIVKTKLVEWILAFRSASDAEDRKRNHETRLRIQRYRLYRNNQRPKALAEAHEDMKTPCSSLQEEGARSAAPRLRKTFNSATTKTAKEETMANPMPEFMPKVCHHGNDIPRYCNVCRMKGWQAQWAWDKAERESARSKDDEVNAARDRALDAYFAQAYPNATPRQRARLALTDHKAQEIAHAY